MADHTAIVAAVKADCVARGLNLLGPCGAFNITGRVAWELRNQGWNLIFKTAVQNGCSYPEHERYAVDALLHNDGTVIDCLINAETENIPAWNPTGSVPMGLARTPFNLDENIPPDPNPDPTNPDLTEIDRKLNLIIIMLNNQNDEFANFRSQYDEGSNGIVSMPGWIGGNRPIVLKPEE
jgi:hypothetical protein